MQKPGSGEGRSVSKELGYTSSYSRTNSVMRLLQMEV